MKKIGLISFALVVALGGSGVGYAMWSDTVTISGPVTTGTLNLSWDTFEGPNVVEYHIINEGQPNESLADGEFEDKDVGSAEAWRSDPETDPVTGKPGWETLNIAVSNAYPGYYVATTFVFRNIGTVPLNLVLYSISGQKQELNGTKIYDLLWGPPDADYWQKVYEDLDDDDVIDPEDPEILNFRITNALPIQIDPCSVEKREIDLHFKQLLQQEKKYVFSVIITAEQWAE